MILQRTWSSLRWKQISVAYQECLQINWCYLMLYPIFFSKKDPIFANQRWHVMEVTRERRTGVHSHNPLLWIKPSARTTASRLNARAPLMFTVMFVCLYFGLLGWKRGTYVPFCGPKTRTSPAVRGPPSGTMFTCLLHQRPQYNTKRLYSV